MSLFKLFDELLDLRVDGFLHGGEGRGDVALSRDEYLLDERVRDLTLPSVESELEADRVHDDVDHFLGFVVARVFGLQKNFLVFGDDALVCVIREGFEEDAAISHSVLGVFIQ